MIGRLDPRERDVTVVGAGLAGLLAAYRLDQGGYHVTLLEAEKRAGGLIQTTQTALGMVESAAHSFLVSPAVARLCGELGVELLPVNAGAKARYIWRGQKLRRYPLTVAETFGLARHVLFARAGRGRLTLDDWGRRHLGAAACDYLLAPFVNGIYASASKELSVTAAFPRLRVPENKTLASVFLRDLRQRKKNEMKAPAAGMGAVTTALERELLARLGSRFCRGTCVDRIPNSPNVVLAVPAAAAARLLSSTQPALARELAAVEYSPLITATVFADTRAFARPPKGVGVLLPPREKRSILGVLFNSSAFAERVRAPLQLTSLTVMLGGSARPELLRLSDSELRNLIAAELEAVLSLKTPLSAERCVIRRWPQAIPKYSQQLESVWRLASQSWCAEPGRLLFGNYTGQVSIRGLIENAEHFLTS